MGGKRGEESKKRRQGSGNRGDWIRGGQEEGRGVERRRTEREKQKGGKEGEGEEEKRARKRDGEISHVSL